MLSGASIVNFVSPSVLRSGATQLNLIVSQQEDSEDRHAISYVVVSSHQLIQLRPHG